MNKSLLVLFSGEIQQFLLQNPDCTEVARHLSKHFCDPDWCHSADMGILVGRYLEYLDARQLFSSRTRVRIENILYRYLDVFGEIDPHSVPLIFVVYWLDKQEWAESTKVWIASIMERLGQFGCDRNLLSWNTMRGLRLEIES